MVDDKLKFIFIHIPKCGGVSMYKALNASRKDQGHAYLCEHMSDSNMDYFKFCFIRNPWDRFVSNYHYFKKFGRDGKGDVKMGSIVNQYDDFKSFTKGINNIPESKLTYNHFDPQYKWFDNRLDFIGRFEYIQKDFDTVCDKIDIPKIKLPHRNKSNHTHYTDYYDDETREIVAEKYAIDIEVFNYKFGKKG